MLERRNSVKKRLKRSWKRPVVIIICLILIIAHQLWPQLKFDIINICLLSIAALVFLFPRLNVFFPFFNRIKRLRAWELELELNELAEKVEQAEISLAESSSVEILKNVPSEVNEIIQEASKDPRIALLVLSSKIDAVVRERLEKAQLDIRTGTTLMRYLPTDQAIKIGIQKGLFPSEILSAYSEFKRIRDRISHNYVFQVDDNKLFSLISLGSEILKIFSTEKAQ